MNEEADLIASTKPYVHARQMTRIAEIACTIQAIHLVNDRAMNQEQTADTSFSMLVLPHRQSHLAHQHLKSSECCEMKLDDRSISPKLVANMTLLYREQVGQTDASVCTPPPTSIVAVETPVNGLRP